MLHVKFIFLPFIGCEGLNTCLTKSIVHFLQQCVCILLQTTLRKKPSAVENYHNLNL